MAPSHCTISMDGGLPNGALRGYPPTVEPGLAGLLSSRLGWGWALEFAPHLRNLFYQPRNLHMNRGLLFFAVWFSAVGIAHGETYSDSFEGPVLNSFWDYVTPNGTTGFWAISPEQAHSGQNSLRFQSNNASAQKTVQISHNFAEPVYGTFSIWLRDPGLGGFYSLFLTPSDPLLASGWGHRVFAADPFFYSYSIPNGSITTTSVSRSATWRQIEISALADAVRYSIDGQMVYSAPSSGPIDAVNFIAHSSLPFETVYWDDFDAQIVPEPSSSALAFAAVASTVTCVARPRRRQRGDSRCSQHG